MIRIRLWRSFDYESLRGCGIFISRLFAAAILASLAVELNAQGAVDSSTHAPADRDPPAAAAHLSAAQVFAFAEAARERRDFDTAKAAYQALSQDPDSEIRTEARFRLGMMLADDLKQYAQAALEFRRILDDKPETARVRLELARMQASLGNMAAARKELRAAQAAGLPASVEQLVRFYSRALDRNKPFGGSMEIAIAPDSNINRATRSDTLGTVIGDFTLDDDAKARSGIGLDLQGQGYARLRIAQELDVLARASTRATLYREPDFNDVTVSVQAGPQYRWNGNQLTLSVGPSWRWYGGDPYSETIGGTLGWQRPLGKRAQIRLDGGVTHVHNKRNALQTAYDYTVSVGVDRALSARFGGGLQLYGLREAARDPGYSLVSGGASAYVFREIDRTTLVGALSYSRLEADARLFLYPERRKENRYGASLAATLRALRLGSFAPLVRVKWERNHSSIEIYDYRRVSAEFGVTSAF